MTYSRSRSVCARRAGTERSTQYLAKVHTRRSTRTDPLCTSRCRKCKLRAKAAVYWCGIYHDIDEMVKSRAPCQAFQVAITKETLIPHDVPKRDWPTLATDLFHWNVTEFLLTADFYSKFPIIRTLRNISSSTIIHHLKGIFDEHGIPERVISDIGPQYSSEEFRVFNVRYRFYNFMSSPWYPPSNGFIERTVQSVTKIFTKAKEGGGDPPLAMLCLRTTPTDHNIPMQASHDDTNRIYHFCNNDRMDTSRTMTELRGNLHPYPHNRQCEC